MQDDDEGGGADGSADPLHDGELRYGVDDLGGVRFRMAAVMAGMAVSPMPRPPSVRARGSATVDASHGTDGHDSAPVIFPLRATGKHPGTTEFEEYYSAQLRTLIRLLAG
ncbi:hypothetical protein [Nocardia aurantiaca]|uniref:Uncharacterized protein n=1 Tax=Nocardia aurantiaca TaxID=2675850 RepID=A0A6I3KPC6_9NOCA|nr:hypothetical protein [Nocardia aurantiaca]MTE12453.1 hypothetical protein [Nocardia aurantiaca]